MISVFADLAYFLYVVMQWGEIGSVFADALSLLIYDVGAAPGPKHSPNIYRKHSTMGMAYKPETETVSHHSLPFHQR